MAVYPVPAPRAVFLPAPSGVGPEVRGGAAPRRAVRPPPARSLGARRARGAVRPTFAFAPLVITPLAPIVGLVVFGATLVLGLVRAIAVVPAVDGNPLVRRRHASRARVGRAGQKVGLGLAAIAVVFCLGLIYVDRSVQISARNYDLDTLLGERDDLLRQQRTLESDLARLGSEGAIAHEALDQGLIRLGPPILLQAR